MLIWGLNLMNKELFELPLAEQVASTPCVEHQQKSKFPSAKLNGVVVPIHRKVFCQSRGVSIEDIKGMSVLRACVNPKCIEPSHLFLYPPYMGNPFSLSTGKGEGKQLWTERIKADPQKYLYWEYRNYPDKEYVN